LGFPNNSIEKFALFGYYLLVRIFKNTWFTRFAAKEAISDDELRSIVDRLEAGQAEADLGGGVYKLRTARSGAGKSGGYRVLVFFRSGERTFFVYGYAKSVRDNIDEKELVKLKQRAKTWLNISDDQIEKALKAGAFKEIKDKK
jgi:hypothetical protein